ncbi:MAG: electron transport complex subunit E [Spirochaetes bacterium]|nr:electron transport complex subunit E [Spirochaetota bacterium]
MNLWKEFTKGLLDENPIFRLALSLCPALAVTSNVYNALGMGFTVMFVITCNNMSVSIFRNVIHPKVRVPVYIISIATIVTVAMLVLEAFFPVLFKELGIYLSLVVVFAIILARAEVFAAKNKVVPSMIDGLGMGLGFVFAMAVIGGVRELIGNGSLLGYQILGSWYHPPLIAVLAPGGFIVIGFIIGVLNLIEKRKQQRLEQKGGQA